MNLRRLLAGGLSLTVLTGALFAAAAAPSSGATATPGEGILCEPGNGVYTMSATTGFETMPDGNSVFTWGYHTPTHAFQNTAPVICATAGDTIRITLTNNLAEDTSFVFPGMSNVQADGVDAVPQSDATGRVTSLAPVAPAKGGQTTYTFTADKPGTYMYESGTDSRKQVEMGLWGAIVVYPACHATGCNQAYDDPRTTFEATREYIHMFSSVDPDIHSAIQLGQPVDWSTYSAKYYLINGRSAPDSLSPNNAAWLPFAPYGSMVRVRPQDPNGGDTLPALVRYVNAMDKDVAFHPHGNVERVIGEDGQPLDSIGKPDNSYGSFLVDIGSNRTAESMFTWTDQWHYDPVTNPIPVPLSPYNDLIIKGTWYAMSPYLGSQGALPPGVTQFNQCGEYYHMAHNHALYAATNYGATFGGQMTLIRIDPLGGCA